MTVSNTTTLVAAIEQAMRAPEIQKLPRLGEAPSGMLAAAPMLTEMMLERQKSAPRGLVWSMYWTCTAPLHPRSGLSGDFPHRLQEHLIERHQSPVVIAARRYERLRDAFVEPFIVREKALNLGF